MPREESFLIPLKYIDVTRTDTTLHAMSEKILKITGTLTRTEICQMHGRGSHGSPYWMQNLQTDMHGSLTRKQTIFRPDTLWPEIWKDVSDASRRKEKQKWAIEKPRGKSWQFRWKLCLARSDEASTGRPVTHLTFASQKWHASSKPTNLQAFGRNSP